ncbi:phage tail protein [Methylobacterium trifolii]|nr:tail fiber protein [Methylobacterium trifolii]
MGNYDAFIGSIILFGGNYAPRGWALCNGQLMNINQYAALYAILGTTYGGNGTTTFGLPNLQGRVPVHAGSGAGLSSYALGQMSGTETVTLNTTQIPAHSHLLAGNADSGNSDSPGNAYFAQTYDANGATTFQTYGSSPSNPVTLNPGVVKNAGGSQPHPNLQPYLALNFIICLEGIFPSRN